MSESDTMFNERDRRCAAVQLMLSTDPSYDNRTIASTFKMQIQTDTTVNACVKEDLKCRSYRRQTSQILTEKTKNLRLIKSIRPSLLSRPEPAGLLHLVIRWKHHQYDLPQHQGQPDRRRVFAELPPALVEKACSQFRICIEAVIEAEGGYIE